jgi:hypothetical protein
MPFYIYETIPRRPEEKPVRFELWQDFTEAALERHPETRQPIHRVGVSDWTKDAEPVPKTATDDVPQRP